MPAYVIADITVINSERYKDYAQKTPATIEKFGGRFVVRGGEIKVIAGDWNPQRLVIIEFPNMATLKKRYQSKEYQKISRIREEASTGSFVFVDGA